MAYVLSEKIRIGVSACNAGAKVRYNRAGWDRLESLGRERSSFLWTPVCPEVMAGLGVPRHPIRLAGGNGDDFWSGGARVKNRVGQDVTDDLRAGMEACLDTLRRAGVEAFVFMEGSPSCGVYRTTLKNKRLGKPPGVFGSLLLREGFFLIPALDLESPIKWWDWRRRLHSFAWLKRQDISSKDQLYTYWNALKFVCQEVDEVEARALGSELAALPRGFDAAAVELWRDAVLKLLRKPSSHKKITSIMNKHFAHYRRHIDPEGPVTPARELSKYKYVEELLAMEKRAVRGEFLFAGTPVIYREERG